MSHEQLMRHWVQEFNKGKEQAVAVLDGVITDDYVMHDPQAPVEGKQAMRDFLTMFFDAFPDAQMTLEEVLTIEDRVVYRARISGTHRGAFMGFAPTGRRFDAPIISVARVIGGRVADEWQVLDMMGLMQQIGALPAPAHA